MNTVFDFEKYREARYKEACEGLDKLEKKRLTEAHTELDNICVRVRAGDRKSMLELIEITADTLLIFDSLPPELQASLANGLKEAVNVLTTSRGFLPRGRGERSEENKRDRENRVFLTALRVERYRRDLDIGLDEAEAKVADESGMKQDLVHKYWKQDHPEAKRQIAMEQHFMQRIAMMPNLFKPGFDNSNKILDAFVESAAVCQHIRRKKKVR